MKDAIYGSDWTEEEVAVCVQTYFDCLAKELHKIPFVKMSVYRTLGAETGRSEKSIERKFQNISAVLDVLDREWITGLAPLANYQELLAEKVALHIDTLDNQPIHLPKSNTAENMMEGPMFSLGPPPPPAVPRNLPLYLKNLARRFDPVERDMRNRALGEAGEKFVLDFEKQSLRLMGRENLADRIVWVSKQEGDGAGYDILSFTPEGQKRFIEVKTTVGSRRTPFFMTRNEHAFAGENSESYSIIRLHDFRRNIQGFEMRGRPENYVNLRTETYRAEF